MAIFFITLFSVILDSVPVHKIPDISDVTELFKFEQPVTRKVTSMDAAHGHTAQQHLSTREESCLYHSNVHESMEQLAATGLNQTQSLAHNHNQHSHVSALDFSWIAGWLCWGIAGLALFARRPSDGNIYTAALE